MPLKVASGRLIVERGPPMIRNKSATKAAEMTTLLKLLENDRHLINLREDCMLTFSEFFELIHRIPLLEYSLNVNCHHSNLSVYDNFLLDANYT